MILEVLDEILAKHRLYLQGEEEGERANLSGANLMDANLMDANLMDANLMDANLMDANLMDADLSSANMRGAYLKHANLMDAALMDANLMDANLSGANMRGANIDYSAWPLWCGSLKAHVDDRIVIQLLYHTLSVVQHSPYVSENIKRTLLTPDAVEVANRFHRVDECGKLEIFNGGTNE